MVSEHHCVISSVQVEILTGDVIVQNVADEEIELLMNVSMASV